MLPLLIALSAIAQESAETAEAAPETPVEAAGDEDSRLWLEEVEGEEALSWVRARNAQSTDALAASGELDPLKAKILEIYDSDDKIPYASARGDWYYNFWKDADHERGIWRRTTFDSYVTDEPEWETMLDIDALNEAEDEDWVWKGASCLRPLWERCLLTLSHGGSDAAIVREFDMTAKAFVEGGFELEEAKSEASWIDEDHLFVATDFGEGSLTESGYPRLVKRWTRGTPLSDAVTVIEGKVTDVAVGAWHDSTPGWERDFAYRAVTFYTNELHEVRGDKLVQVDKPEDTEAKVHKQFIYFENRSDWEIDGTTYPKGSLLVADYKKWMKGKRVVEALFTPTESTSLAGWSFTADHLLLNSMEHVRSRVEVLTPGKKGWTRQDIEGLPEFGDISAWPVDDVDSNAFWLNVMDFLTPTSLWHGEVGAEAPKQLKQVPAFFDTEGLVVSQHFATSKDGTAVPYFQIAPTEIPEGGLPTLLYGYGGFEISMQPFYSGHVGVGWLEKGGVYVLSNIRGGGEYGPRWHQAALKENRHRSFEDFAAIGEHLVERGVTTPKQLGVMGGSNGGLLVGNAYTLYPDHWGAVVCQVPLLDMKRYTQLLAGASWAGEYGDPEDPEQWEYIRTFSPYHNIDPAVDYPPILFATSTKDDRVHPAHARKMAHALLEAGKEVVYYENIEGGHGGAANNDQAAYMRALGWQFLWQTLAGDGVELPEEPAVEGEPVEGAETAP